MKETKKRQERHESGKRTGCELADWKSPTSYLVSYVGQPLDITLSCVVRFLQSSAPSCLSGGSVAPRV